ncbi:lysylphosphatidylglycerol synthase transmembrane domain-containing protein [Desulfobacula sp.]|uniref:lysylphosphatidylglycerol synthase transmembrane domain-containing protein n=1 Tax=Desulfobacula sp. TaxID=2593537 RepID=UPI001EBFD2C4|nr:flippase-like domain-containing protein [Desulfobacula sp.]
MVPGNSKWLIKFGVTLLLLIYLGFNMDWDLIGKTIFSIKIFPFIVSCMISLLSSIPLAIRLRILLKPTVLEFSLIRLIQVQFISQFYSLFLPSGVGVSIARWYKITQNRYGRGMFFAITVLERAMFLMTLLLCAGIPLLFAKDEAIQTFRSSILPVIFFLLVGCFLFFSFFLHSKIYNKFSLIIRWIQSKFSSNLIRNILGIYEDIELYVKNRHLLIKAFIPHMFFQALDFIHLYLLFVALSVNLPIITILWISMLVLLIMTIPFTIGGLGVREAGLAWFLSLYGFNPETGVLLGGMMFMQLCLHAGLGAILNILETRQS